MARDECSTRLLPGYDDDEVVSPPFRFDRFERLMAQSYLANIRDPDGTSFSFHDWFSKFAPHWRWALAHHGLRSSGPGLCDDDTYAAYQLLRARTGEFNLHPGIKPLVDAILIHERNDRTRWLLEAHLLLPEPPANLAAKLGLHPATLRYYESWFFDVRSRLSKSSWIHARALGGFPWLGFADDDLGPIWRRMAYCGKSERVLDIAVAVTTNAGRERYSEAECDAVQFQVESLRLSAAREPDRVLQLERRLAAERNGESPAAYHMARRLRNPSNTIPSESRRTATRS